MSELIRKSDVIEIMENLIYDMSEVSTIPQLAKSEIEKLEPVNAVELPCKVGDMVYIYFKHLNEVYGYKVTDFHFTDNQLFVECAGIRFNATDFEKDVFFTREEAEKALEKMKGKTE